jgi:hypothetical protein
METVDKATSQIDVERQADDSDEETPATRKPAAAPPAVSDPWTGFLQAGTALLQELTAPQRGGKKPTGGLARFVERDERSGESFLRLPVPKPEMLQEALAVLTKLLATSA